MYLAPHRPGRRRGVSLLEVLVAMTIFLMCFAAIGGLISLAADRAAEVQHETIAFQMCQSKLNEVLAGVVPLQSASGEVEEDPEWSWSLEAVPHETIGNLWTVEVRVHRVLAGQEVSATMSAMVLDPSVRGNASDKPVSSATSDTPTTDSSSTTTPATSSSSSSSPTGGGGTTTTAPSTGGGTSTAPRTTSPAPSSNSSKKGS